MKIIYSIGMSLFLLLPTLQAKSQFTENEFYTGFGWKTFGLGYTDNEKTLVNGGAVRVNAGLFIPTKNIKLEFAASLSGGLGYKDYINGVEVENKVDISLQDYTASIAYGTGKKIASFDSFPFVLLGAGAKVVTYNDLEIVLPSVQVAIGFSIRTNHIEFFAKFSDDLLFNLQKFTLDNGDIIAIKRNGAGLEVGFNYVF